MKRISNKTLIKTIQVLIVIVTIAHHNPFMILLAFPLLIVSILLYWRTDKPTRSKLKWTLIPLGLIIIGYSTLAAIAYIYF